MKRSSGKLADVEAENLTKKEDSEDILANLRSGKKRNIIIDSETYHELGAYLPKTIPSNFVMTLPMKKKRTKRTNQQQNILLLPSKLI